MSTVPNVIEVQIDRTDESGNQTVETVEINLDLNSLTLRESVALEEALGTEAFDALMEKGEFAMRPSVIQAVLYSKVKGRFPEVGINDFDFDLSALDTGTVEDGGGPNS